MKQFEKNSIKKIGIRIGLAAILLAAAIWYLHVQQNPEEFYTIKTVPPTCAESGYSLYTNRLTGATTIHNVIKPLDHTYGQWQVQQEQTEILPEILVRKCQGCGLEEFEKDYPDIGIPRISISGDLTGIGKKEEVPAIADLVTEDNTLESYISIKYQGHSSLIYDRKNYTVKFYLDEGRDRKNKMVFSHWNPESKYILKANYTDPSRCKNLICADLWADMVKSREKIPQEFLLLSNYGAVDGFPIALYFDDEFHGLYTMNIHKDDDLFGMQDGAAHAIMIVNHPDGAEAQFRESAAFAAESPWEVEYCGTENTLWAQEKLNALIDFVQTSSDAEFRTHIGEYLDLESAVDYVIAMYAFGLQEHGAKDLLLVTYGKKSPWICSMYDMEEAFDADGCMPSFNGTSWESGTKSLLWDRFLNAFYPEICTRYETLRHSLLDPDTLCSRAETYIAQIPDIIYKADAAARGSELYTNAQRELMADSIRQTISELDSVFLTERK